MLNFCWCLYVHYKVLQAVMYASSVRWRNDKGVVSIGVVEEVRFKGVMFPLIRNHFKFKLKERNDLFGCNSNSEN